MDKPPENKKPKTTGKNAVEAKAKVKAKIKKGAKKSLTPQEKKEAFKQFNRERLKNLMEYRKERYGGNPYGDYSKISRAHAKQFKTVTGANFRDPAADPTFAHRDKSALSYNKQALDLSKQGSEAEHKQQQEIEELKLEAKRLKITGKQKDNESRISTQRAANALREQELIAANRL
jgi:hypothetical protein